MSDFWFRWNAANGFLIVNDYGLDSNNAKVAGIVRLVNQLNSGDLLVDGIGSQAHLSAGQTFGVQAALTALAAANGVSQVAITGKSRCNFVEDSHRLILLYSRT